MEKLDRRKNHQKVITQKFLRDNALTQLASEARVTYSVAAVKCLFWFCTRGLMVKAFVVLVTFRKLFFL